MTRPWQLAFSLSLSEMDREVECRFYSELQSATDTERDLGLQAGYVEELKASVKRRDFFRRGGPCHLDNVWQRQEPLESDAPGLHRCDVARCFELCCCRPDC